mmetsp:Transcript_7834/g.19526  ORF Transcript_7834/g.19526 Transcript_7834/m.19526 type:complete len:295 (+) Transcript_7834:512-1396(+)
MQQKGRAVGCILRARAPRPVDPCQRRYSPCPTPAACWAVRAAPASVSGRGLALRVRGTRCVRLRLRLCLSGRQARLQLLKRAAAHRHDAGGRCRCKRWWRALLGPAPASACAYARTAKRAAASTLCRLGGAVACRCTGPRLQHCPSPGLLRAPLPEGRVVHVPHAVVAAALAALGGPWLARLLAQLGRGRWCSSCCHVAAAAAVTASSSCQTAADICEPCVCMTRGLSKLCAGPCSSAMFKCTCPWRQGPGYRSNPHAILHMPSHMMLMRLPAQGAETATLGPSLCAPQVVWIK